MTKIQTRLALDHQCCITIIALISLTLLPKCGAFCPTSPHHHKYHGRAAHKLIPFSSSRRQQKYHHHGFRVSPFAKKANFNFLPTQATSRQLSSTNNNVRNQFTWNSHNYQKSSTARRQTETEQEDPFWEEYNSEPEKQEQQEEQKPEEEESPKDQQQEELKKENQRLFSDGYTEDDEVDFVWEAGDVEADLNALEQAITYANADLNLQQAERIEMLDAIAGQRRPLLEDMQNFVISTVLRWSLIFVVLHRLLQSSYSTNKIAQIMVDNRLLTFPWNVHFWIFVVLAPIDFLQFKRRTMGPPPPKPAILDQVGPEYARLVRTDWEDPETSCRDYVLCLAEQWASAVKGVAWFGLFRLVCFVASTAVNLPKWIRTLPYFPPTMIAILQLLTRLAAMASLWQFPELIFKLERPQQPRPVKGDVASFQKLVQSLFRWGFPVGLASDLSQILMVVPARGQIAFYSTTVAILAGMEILYNKSRQPSTQNERLLAKLKTAIRWMGRAAFITLGSLAGSVGLGLVIFYLIAVKRKPISLLRSIQTMSVQIPWMHVLANGVLLVALIPPIWHLIAFQCNLDIMYMHDVSLSNEPEARKDILDNPEERAKRYQWRYRLRWRKPERVGVIVRRQWEALKYRLFFSGTVAEKIYQEEEAALKKKYRYEKIWDWVRRDLKFDPERFQTERKDWTKDALEIMKYKHQDSYNRNAISEDPLGIALMRRIGIGLKFDADFNRKLKPGEKPSMRRLQARAAKSALVRVNNLYKNLNKQKRVLEKEIADPQKREEMLQSMQKEIDGEINCLAKRFSELIPTNSGPEDYAEELEFEIPKITGFKLKKIQVGGQYVDVIDSSGGAFERSSVMKMLERISEEQAGLRSSEPSYEIVPLEDDYNTTNIDDISDIKPESRYDPSSINNENESLGQDDDEFMKAYLKQRFGGPGNDDDDDPDVVLV